MTLRSCTATIVHFSFLRRNLLRQACNIDTHWPRCREHTCTLIFELNEIQSKIIPRDTGGTYVSYPYIFPRPSSQLIFTPSLIPQSLAPLRPIHTSHKDLLLVPHPLVDPEKQDSQPPSKLDSTRRLTPGWRMRRSRHIPAYPENRAPNPFPSWKATCHI